MFLTLLRPHLASITPILVGIVGAVMWRYFQYKADVIELVPNSDEGYGNEALRRYSVAAAFMTLLTIEFVTIIYATRTVWRRSKGERARFWTYSVASIFSGVISCYLVIRVFSCHHIDAIGRPIFVATIGRMGLLYSLEMFIKVSSAVAAIASGATMAAVCSLVPVSELNKSELADRIQQLKYYLGFAALLLFSGVATMSAWVSWPLGFYNIEEEVWKISQYKAIANSTIVFFSCFYVLGLVATFVPVALRLQREALRLAREALAASTIAERRAWMLKNELALSIGEAAQRVAAILSPIVVPFASLLW